MRRSIPASLRAAGFLPPALLLAACGGGGGGAAPQAMDMAASDEAGAAAATAPASPPDVPFETINDQIVTDRPYLAGRTPADFETAQYAASPASRLGASEAYARGALGGGSRIGVLDLGVNDPAGLFEDRLESDPGYAHGGGFGAEDSHGLIAASIIGARRGGGAGFHGIAPEATIVSYDVSFPDRPGLIDLGRVRSAFAAATANGVDAVNMSFGTSAPAGWPLDIGDRFLDDAIAAAEAGLVFFVAAGNDGSDEVHTLAALPIYAKDFLRRMGREAEDNPLLGRWLSVAALDAEGGALAGFSNRCGLAKAFCLAAPGERVPGLNVEGRPIFASGTSFSVAHVAGAFAVLRSMWPDLDEETLVEVILRTADDLGAAGVDQVFGYGRLNLARAAAPVGQLSLPAAAEAPDVDREGDLRTSAFVAGRAMGGALERMAAKGPAFAVVDAYGRGFSIDMAAFAREARQRSNFAEDFRGFVTRRDLEIETVGGGVIRLVADPADGPSAARAIRFGREETLLAAAARDGLPSDLPGVASFAGSSAIGGGAFIDPRRTENPFLALADTTTGAGVSARTGPAAIGGFVTFGEGETGAAVASAGVTAAMGDADTGARATLGLVRETGAMLGSSGVGLFAFGDGETLFGSFSGRVELPKALGAPAALVGDAHLGLTRMGSGGGLIRGGEATSLAWTAGVETSGILASDDAVTLALDQPLTVVSGSLDYLAPTPHGLSPERAALSQTPPLNLEIGWRWSPGDGETMGLGGFATVIEGDGAQDYGMALRYAKRF